MLRNLARNTQGECLPSETADDLYQQIQSEKQRLISEKKVKKEKSLPEISADEIPFDIPDNWRWCYVGDLFLHNTGKAQNSSGSTNGTIRKFITTSNLYWGEFDFTKVKEMPFTDTELERCTVKKGDLLVCEGGDCGRSAVWDYDEEVCIQNHVHRLRPYRDVNIYYFYYLFYLYKNTGRLRGRGVAIQGLSNEAIHKVVLPLAPLEEQHRIVAKIEELLPYVDRYATAYEKLEQFNAKFPEDMKKSILQYAIQGKLVEQRPEEGTGKELYQQIQIEKQRLIKEGKIKMEKPLPEISEDEVPFEIPDSWRWCYVGNLFNHNTGKAMNSSAKKTDKPGAIRPFITTSNVYWNSFDFSVVKEMFFSDDEVERCTVTKGDILMCEGGAYFGRTAIWNYDYDICFQNHVHRLRPYQEIDLMFFYHIFFFYKNMNMMKAKGTAMPGLSSITLHQMIIPLPPLAEQKRIIAKLEEILPLCERLK